MNRSNCLAIAISATMCCASIVAAGETLRAPRDREGIKRLVVAQMQAEPFIPLPPGEDGKPNRTIGNGGMRQYYLPKEWPSGRSYSRRSSSDAKDKSGRDAGRASQDSFSTEMFWIVSRLNDCRYCLGHQEEKLARAGLPEERIARLDGDWSEFTAAEQAAYAYARKVTLEPHKVGRADIDALRKHYDDAKVLSIVNINARYNSTNRWTGGLNITQDREIYPDDARRPTPLNVETKLLPTVAIERPVLEPRAEVEKILTAIQTREPHVPIPSLALSNEPSTGRVPNWARVAASDSDQAAEQYKQAQAIFTTGRIPRLLKAQIAWVSARHNRAWYALGTARKRLRELGQSDDVIFALDHASAPGRDAPTMEALALAKKLTIYPQLMDRADFDRLRKHFSNHEIAEIVYLTCYSNSFDRQTEPLGLPLEG